MNLQKAVIYYQHIRLPRDTGLMAQIKDKTLNTVVSQTLNSHLRVCDSYLKAKGEENLFIRRLYGVLLAYVRLNAQKQFTNITLR